MLFYFSFSLSFNSSYEIEDNATVHNGEHIARKEWEARESLEVMQSLLLEENRNELLQVVDKVFRESSRPSVLIVWKEGRRGKGRVRKKG